jgi:hypothetical protein
VCLLANLKATNSKYVTEESFVRECLVYVDEINGVVKHVQGLENVSHNWR